MKINKIWIITLFPEYFVPLCKVGVAGQALSGSRGVEFKVETVQLRDHCLDDYKGVDDSPFGGGAGMVMRADILKNALIDGVVKKGNYDDDWKEKLHVIYPGPRGKVWNHNSCREFANRVWDKELGKDLVFICGRYEGIDERFIENYVDEQISLGDYIVTGGEVAVLAILDSALRFLPGVLGNKNSANEDSFENGILEHPQYTKPREFDGLEVPEVLLSGHHKKIEEYRNSEKMRITKIYRPDLLVGEK